MRELFKALSELETRLMEQYGVSLNEAMALCCIGGDTLMASVISEKTGLSASHTSKVIRSIEEKELIVRNLGDKDKRQMHFTLSTKIFGAAIVWHTFGIYEILVLVVALILKKASERNGIIYK